MSTTGNTAVTRAKAASEAASDEGPVVRVTDGVAVLVYPDGRTEPYDEPETDWAAQDALTDEDIERMIAEDPDVAPDTSKLPNNRRWWSAPVDVRQIRKKLGLSQPEFAARFSLPLGTVRGWEQGRRQPDGAVRVLLMVIDREPEAVRRALGMEEVRERQLS